MTAFTPKIQKWLELNRPFVNALGGSLQCSPFGGRSLGPASGNIADAYPFLNHSAFTGLLAGLSLSGIEPGKRVRLKQYAAKFGFRPAANSPFESRRWQNLSSNDWLNIEPSDYPADKPVNPVHDLDLIFLVQDNELSNELSTAGWSYTQQRLSDNYLRHNWVSSEGIVAVAITFLAVPQNQAPFLRPCYVPGDAEIDPYCIFTKTESTVLVFKTAAAEARRTVIMNSGTNVSVAGQDDTITVSKSAGTVLNPYIRRISGVSADETGNVSLLSEGCYKFKANYESLDPNENTAVLEPAVICVQNQCKPCCNCADYVERYEELRQLFEQQTTLIQHFNQLYRESVELRDKFETMLRNKARLVDVSLYTWNKPQSNTIRCDFILSVIGRKNTPVHNTAITFGNPAAGFRIISYESNQSDGLDFDIEKTGAATLRISGVETNYIGLKQVRLRVQFAADSIPSTFDPTEITLNVVREE